MTLKCSLVAVSCLFIRGVSGAWLELCDPLELTRGRWQVRLMGLSSIWGKISFSFTLSLDLMCLQAAVFASAHVFLFYRKMLTKENIFLLSNIISFSVVLLCSSFLNSYQIVLSCFQCFVLFMWVGEGGWLLHCTKELSCRFTCLYILTYAKMRLNLDNNLKFRHSCCLFPTMEMEEGLTGT